MPFYLLFWSLSHSITKQIALPRNLLWSVFNLSVSVQVTVNPYNALHCLTTATL